MGNFKETTVEITHNGKKVRVSKDVAEAIKKSEELTKKNKTKN